VKTLDEARDLAKGGARVTILFEQQEVCRLGDRTYS